jgi:hypothetical protein
MKKSTEFLFLALVAILIVVAVQYLMVEKRTIINCNHLNRAYAFDVVDDSIFVYTEDDKLVGGVKIEGQLDSLIIEDNR